MGSKRNRAYYLDALRVVAIFLVLFNHTGRYGFQLYVTATPLPVQTAYLVISSLCKVAVPLFLMVSGALLLGKDEPVSVVWRKRVLRMVAVLLIFSTFRYVFRYFTLGTSLVPGEFARLLA